ncbi:hypothetical protein WA026_005507 [Henosepilachna vigintioctopunctata]
MLIGKNEDVLIKLAKFFKKFDGVNQPLKFWLGSKLCIIFTNPHQVEKILFSQKLSHKMEIYDILKRFVGEGLITASGAEYRRHKKIIVPILDLNFINSLYDVFLKYSQKCTEDLMFYCNKGTLDIEPFIHDCFLRTVSHAFLGKEYDEESKDDHQFKLDVIEIYDKILTRLIRPWLHPDFIYQMTSLAKREDELMQRCHAYIGKAVIESWRRFQSGTASNKDIIPLIDFLTERVAEHPDLMNEKFFFDHIFTLFLASEDTLTIIASFLCVCLGMYPEYQEKLAEELRRHFGETPRAASMEDISRLPYLEMCIKETLRVVPIGPILLRKITEECEIDGWKLPEGASLLMPVYFIHRDRRYWQNPDHFYPDHFLPEAVKGRPTYAYMPFSGGIRGCIGKVFSNVNLKIFMATFLQRFEVEADGKLPDIKFKIDISVRPINGYKVRIKKRQWK